MGIEIDLVKKDLNSKSMQDAVKDYISRVDEVANLLPVTLFVDTAIIHLFARTRSTPYVYYYRSYDQTGKQWKPWEKMDVEIQYHDDPEAVGQGGAFMIPAMVGGRLIVFCPQIIKQVAKGEDIQREKPLDMVEHVEIKLGWSEYRNGKWTPKKLSSEAVRSTPQMSLDHPVRELRFRLDNLTTIKAKITIDEIGTFEFKDGCCADMKVKANFRKVDQPWDKYEFNKIQLSDKSLIARSSDWSVSDNPHSLNQHSLDGQETAVRKLQDLLSQLELQKEAQDPMTVAQIRTLWQDIGRPIKRITLTHGASTGMLTHTSASTTLDRIYTYVHTLTDAIAANELESPTGIYDWELGLHAPSFLMDKLTSSHQYEKALEIARFVFNPMASGADNTSPDGVWKWAPFRKISARGSFELYLGHLTANQPSPKVNEWRNTPFQPHAVARGRPVAYMIWMVMRYIKILIAAGDQLFRQETMESMPLAIQYYTLAAHLSGPPSQKIPKHTKTTPKTFNTLIESWDAFPFAKPVGTTHIISDTGLSLGYFCVPRNPAIRDLRIQIDDRLYKIRHCQDINGITHKLALFEPPIDPGALVRAAASGLSLSSVLESISGPMPNYRFQYLLRGALEMVQELKSLAGAFLSAKEKLDSEAYQRIRAGHESTINAVVLDLKKLSRNEAKKAIGTHPICLIFSLTPLRVGSTD